MQTSQTNKEELWNTITHGVGFVFAFLGIIILFVVADLSKINLRTGLILYSTSLLLLYAASTSYHYVESKKLKKKLRVLDHISIYFLIAGTYSPLVLTLLKDGNGQLLFYIVWGFALLGAFLKLFFTGKFEKISLILYLLMGSLIVLDALTVFKTFRISELIALCLGGLFYIIGIYFYVKTSIRFNHVIWHIFVILGSFSHFLMIYFSVSRL
jgi:hemolysin III